MQHHAPRIVTTHTALRRALAHQELAGAIKVLELADLRVGQWQRLTIVPFRVAEALDATVPVRQSLMLTIDRVCALRLSSTSPNVF
jgi:hypothetical protein